jgi:hypothetical protein
MGELIRRERTPKDLIEETKRVKNVFTFLGKSSPGVMLRIVDKIISCTYIINHVLYNATLLLKYIV